MGGPLVDDRLTRLTDTHPAFKTRGRWLTKTLALRCFRPCSSGLLSIEWVGCDSCVLLRGNLMILIRLEVINGVGRRFDIASELISSFSFVAASVADLLTRRTLATKFRVAVVSFLTFSSTGGRIDLLPTSIGFSTWATRIILTLPALIRDGIGVKVLPCELLR